LFRDGQFYSARGGGNRSSLKKTTDLPQVTDKLYLNFAFFSQTVRVEFWEYLKKAKL
jgi:hypothetical protein